MSEKLYRLKPEVLQYVESKCRKKGTLDYWKGTIYKETALEEIVPMILNKTISIEIHPDEVKLTWDEAVEYCKHLGDGWRLPTIQELWYILENKHLISLFKDHTYYWSSSVYYADCAWYFSFGSGSAYGTYYKDYTYGVRVVKDIKQPDDINNYLNQNKDE